MSKHSKKSQESNILDDSSFRQQDRDQFAAFMGQTSSIGVDQTTPSPGTLLKGRIVEITKDHVVVDVGLKSEGLVPIEEFSDPSMVELDGEIEVYLDQARR